MSDDGLVRCAWVPPGDELYRRYHDEEWGTPQRDPQALFELLVLETFQAGLSWRLILGRREEFRRAFAGFAAERMARWTDADLERLATDPGIIRNRLKISAARSNARAFLAVQEQHGSFADWLWAFTAGTPVVGQHDLPGDVPARTELSDLVSRELRKAGFRFIGSVTVYAYLQAAGLVQDHLRDCFRFAELESAQRRSS